MKKNFMMRAASGLFIAVMLTTSIISGTLAKYTTSAASNDKARVAKWGLGTATLSIEDLFSPEYAGTSGNTVVSEYGDDVIAPGTTGKTEFAFECTGDAPEVAYTLTVSTEGSVCDPQIKNNPDIIWSLDGTPCDSFDDMLTKIQGLGSTDVIAPNTLPANFGASDTHEISWEWLYENGADADAINTQDAQDTYMGIYAVQTANIEVSIVITITATQVD